MVALRRFQNERSLEPTGATNRATWRALDKLTPKRIRWSRRSRPGFLKAATPEPKLGSALELPATPGRP